MTTGQPAANYIANAEQAIERAPRGTAVLDGAVPDQVKDSSNGTRVVIGSIRPGKLAWIEHPRGTIDRLWMFGPDGRLHPAFVYGASTGRPNRSEEHTSELQSRSDLVCRLLLEKKKKNTI